MFSSCRTQPTQYCGVTIRRGRSDRLAPPRCHSVPLVIASDPDDMVSLMASGRLPSSWSASLVKCAGCTAPSIYCPSHRWLPGMILFGRVVDRPERADAEG